MALHRAVFSLTADGNGHASADVHVRSTMATRGGQLLMVTVDRSQCYSSYPVFTLSELDDVSSATWNHSTETQALGKQLAFIDTRRPVTDGSVADEYDPRHNITTLRGDTPTYDVTIGLETIYTAYVRCEMDGATSGDIVSLVMWYESAGDYRF